MKDDDWINAAEACRLLGVRAQTLYAYASRNLLRAIADPADARRSLYRRMDVDALAMRQGRSRKLADVAAAAIAWGEPVLHSAITTVRDGRLYYRGLDAVGLSESATLEDVASILIGADLPEPRRRAPLPLPSGATQNERLFQALAVRTTQAPMSAGADISALAEEAKRLLNLVCDAIVGESGHGPIHLRLAKAWGVDPAKPACNLIRRILVLLADHELNASTFAARVTASTGASLAASLLSGLAALSGPRHGGMGAEVRHLLAEASENGPSEAVALRLTDGGTLPGFGHPLYPQGDIRANAVLGRIDIPDALLDIKEVAWDQAGLAPNIDFALTAAGIACGLPGDAPFALFAAARSAGWIAHAIEQNVSGQLIRPRARYIGADIPASFSSDRLHNVPR
jgi:citrate synthase